MGQLKLDPERRKILSDNIRKFIDACRTVSFKGIAIDTGVSTKQLRRWYNGTAIPLERNLKALATALGTDYERMLMTVEESFQARINRRL